MTSTASTPPVAPAVGGVQTVRRLITYALLAATVFIAASGLSGLLDRLFTLDRLEVSFDSYGLATSLASALVAGPLSGLLWWLIWRDATMARDRASVLWPVYLVIVSTVSLLVFTIALLSWLADTIRYGWTSSGLAIGIVWALVWVWHYWMWQHPRKAPTRLQGAAPALASLIGLTYGAGGLVAALSILIDTAADSAAGIAVLSDPLWQVVAQPIVWAVGCAWEFARRFLGSALCFLFSSRASRLSASLHWGSRSRCRSFLSSRRGCRDRSLPFLIRWALRLLALWWARSCSFTTCALWVGGRPECGLPRLWLRRVFRSRWRQRVLA